jgi:hypothetical protein
MICASVQVWTIPSWTWFKLLVGRSKVSGEKWYRNIHTHSNSKEHLIEISDGELYEKAKSGNVPTVRLILARFPGWKNTVKLRYDMLLIGLYSVTCI